MCVEYLGEKKLVYVGCLFLRDLYLIDFEILGELVWVGKILFELNLGKKYGVYVVFIFWGKCRINILGGFICLFLMDKI